MVSRANCFFAHQLQKAFGNALYHVLRPGFLSHPAFALLGLGYPVIGVYFW